jgi:hypothetical protein
MTGNFAPAATLHIGHVPVPDEAGQSFHMIANKEMVRCASRR